MAHSCDTPLLRRAHAMIHRGGSLLSEADHLSRSEHGAFGVHIYPYTDDRSTFIVETDEQTWQRAGMEHFSEQDTIEYCESLFARQLEGHRLLSNRSLWTQFRTVHNRRWHVDNLVLIGDAAHTAHFSVGSGTKMAMEDALALSQALTREPDALEAALDAFEEERRPRVEHIQRMAATSFDWWAGFRHYTDLPAERFSFHFLTRSQFRYDTLRPRDPGYLARVEEASGLTDVRALAIAAPAQVPAPLASTAAGSLTVGMNAANNVVNPATSVQLNATFAHPGAGGGPTTGSLTVLVDGVAQVFNYNFGVGGNASTVDAFVSNFNAAQLGVTASFDSVSQKIVFTRDPNNTGPTHRALQGGNPTTPTFTINDSNAPAGGKVGTPSTSILEILGATAISGVQQNNTNAFGAGDNGAANALLKLFGKPVGAPALQTTSPTAIAGPGSVTVAPPAANPAAFAPLDVGQLLTIGAGTANQENVVVTAVNRATGTITFSATLAHAANFAIATAATTTLGAYYGGLVGQLGLDVQNATTGNAAQTSLAANIDKVRQGIDGINLDEEAQNLIRFQNSYQAAARTMNVLDTLLQTAIGLIK